MKTTNAKNGKKMIEIEDPLINEWLSTMKKTTKEVYATYFRRLLEFDPSITGKEMLEQKEKWEMVKIYQFKAYLAEKGHSLNGQKTALGAVRSFFSKYRKSLTFTKQEKNRINEAQNETEGIFFSKDDMVKMWNLSTLADLSRWVLCNKSMGLRASDFAKTTFGKLRGIDLNQECPISFGKINTGKENVIANVFLDGDVIHTIQELLELHKDAKDSDLVFPHNNEHLTYILKNLAIKAQIKSGEKEVSFHALRRFLYDRLTNVMSDDKAKMIIGKATHETAYLSTDALREQFKKVLAEISINGNGAIKAVKAEVQAQGQTIEQLVKLLAERDKTIGDLTAKISTLESDKNSMRKEIDSHDSDILEIQTKLGIKPKPIKEMD